MGYVRCCIIQHNLLINLQTIFVSFAFFPLPQGVGGDDAPGKHVLREVKMAFCCSIFRSLYARGTSSSGSGMCTQFHHLRVSLIKQQNKTKPTEQKHCVLSLGASVCPTHPLFGCESFGAYRCLQAKHEDDTLLAHSKASFQCAAVEQKEAHTQQKWSGHIFIIILVCHSEPAMREEELCSTLGLCKDVVESLCTDLAESAQHIEPKFDGRIFSARSFFSSPFAFCGCDIILLPTGTGTIHH